MLVKSWLLAIPHFLILGSISASQVVTYNADNEWVRTTTGLSLVGVLVLIVGIALLFTGSYPRGLFDLLMGINRWMFRVVAYVALFRDDYPPFRLDMGGEESVGVPTRRT